MLAAGDNHIALILSISQMSFRVVRMQNIVESDFWDIQQGMYALETFSTTILVGLLHMSL